MVNRDGGRCADMTDSEELEILIEWFLCSRSGEVRVDDLEGVRQQEIADLRGWGINF